MRASRLTGLILAGTVAATLGVPGPATAQDNVAQLVRVTPVRGHSLEFEEGLKRYMAVALEADIDDTWLVWEVAFGEEAGAFYIGTFGHQWGDFDDVPEGASALQNAFRVHLEPWLERADVGLWTNRTDLSHGAVPEGMPAAFSHVYWFDVRSGAQPTAEEAMARIVAAAEDQAWAQGWSTWQLLVGGRGARYAVSLDFPDFASMAEPSPTMMEVMATSMGRDEAMETLQSFSGTLAEEWSEVLAFRQDLSLIPDAPPAG